MHKLILSTPKSNQPVSPLQGDKKFFLEALLQWFGPSVRVGGMKKGDPGSPRKKHTESLATENGRSTTAACCFDPVVRIRLPGTTSPRARRLGFPRTDRIARGPSIRGATSCFPLPFPLHSFFTPIGTFLCFLVLVLLGGNRLLVLWCVLLLRCSMLLCAACCSCALFFDDVR